MKCLDFSNGLYYYKGIHYLWRIALFRKEDIEEVIGYSKHNYLSSAINPVNGIKNSKSLESKVWK